MPYIRDPNAFDPTAYSRENDRVHTTVPGHFSVTATSHPALFEVFELISSDNGGGAGHASYSVPDHMLDRATIAQAFLARLSPDERETVAYGEEGFAEAVMRVHAQDDAERETIDGFLTSFFEGWHDEPEVARQALETHNG